MESSTQESIYNKYTETSKSKMFEFYITIKEDQSRILIVNNNNYKVEVKINIGPNVNIKNQKKIKPTVQEKEFFKKKIKVTKKTELCKNWELYNDCYYKSTCSFAHGEAELRQKSSGVINQKYKTKRCKAFFEKLYCPFGSRCQYLHFSEDGHVSYIEKIYKLSNELYTRIVQREHSDDFNLSRILNSLQNQNNAKRYVYISYINFKYLLD